MHDTKPPVVSTTIGNLTPDMVRDPDGWPGAISLGHEVFLSGAGSSTVEQATNLRDALTAAVVILNVRLALEERAS